MCLFYLCFFFPGSFSTYILYLLTKSDAKVQSFIVRSLKIFFKFYLSHFPIFFDILFLLQSRVGKPRLASCICSVKKCLHSRKFISVTSPAFPADRARQKPGQSLSSHGVNVLAHSPHTQHSGIAFLIGVFVLIHI